MSANSLMIQGTASSAGKSLITTGLCRIFANDGIRVAPFKSQNMALNSFITTDGLEMGRAQVTQAQAARLNPEVRMNPVLLKPESNHGSQVIAMGEVAGFIDAADWRTERLRLRGVVEAAYASLAADYDLIVIEGAGSPAEINLNDGDFVNMGMAEIADAPVLLVADIDKGGVFASIYGTVMLLPPEQRARFRGVIINKFRGDVSLLDDGLKKIEALTGVPVLGVVPMLDIDIDDEDAITVRHARAKAAHAADLIDIAVIALPRISNSTDFNALDRNPLVNLRYLRNPQDLGSPDLVILPGTKSTLADLDWLRRTGLAPAITALAQSGTPVIGICGGYQMLGRRLSDPFGVEGGGRAPGLGLLDTETTFTPDKTRTLVEGSVTNTTGFFAPLSGAGFTGYEIHMGETTGRHERFAELRMVSDSACNGGNEASPDGQVSDHVLGSYVHGLFDGEFGDHLVRLLATNRGLNADFEELDAVAYQESQFELLADALRNHLDLDAIRQIAGTNT